MLRKIKQSFCSVRILNQWYFDINLIVRVCGLNGMLWFRIIITQCCENIVNPLNVFIFNVRLQLWVCVKLQKSNPFIYKNKNKDYNSM